MNLSTECLEASQVDSLLQGNLTPEEYESAQNHLELCEKCRDRIEAAIGPEQWWSDVQNVLLNSRTGSFSQRNAFSTDAEPNEPSTTKLLDLLGPTDDPNMLGRIGSYEIIGLLGQGGMGAVFKGFDRSLNRFVAIKMLLPHLAASGAARKRFAREGQAVAAVVDDHVMATHCVDEWQGVPYLVMTYSRGVSLQKRLSDNGPLEVREILRIGVQAAKGLAAAHAQGIVHRDIKPANIFLDQSVERVQLMDFGLARAVDDASLTRSGTLAGTPQYMSPEQARAETVDHRSDLFSLGSVMYAMCTGHAPFRAESSYSVLRLITDKEPRPIREVNPDVPDWLCTIIGKLMAKEANVRFESAKEVAELLKDCLAYVQQPTIAALPDGLVDRSVPGSFSYRSRTIGVFAMFAVVCSIIVALLPMQTPDKLSSTPNPNPAAETSDDHDRIQGAWQFDAKSLPTMPAGNQFSVSFLADRMSFSGPQKAGIGTFRLSPDTVPKQIDCRLTFAEKQLEFIGIYEFHDDQLWLCLTEGEQRPKSFDNPPALARLMNFSLERKRVKLPEVDSNASLALSDWSQSQVGAGVFATYTLSIPGIETISQGLAGGGPAVKEFSGIPGGPEKVFTLRYFLPNLSPRGMEFVARNSFRSSLDLIELTQVAEHKRLVKVFSYPDSATEPIASNLTISVLKAGANQADWLKEIDATGEIIYGYEVVVR